MLLSQQGFSRHIAGGELFYEWLGNGSTANTYRYKITLRLFRTCNSDGPQLISERVVVGVYANESLVNSLTLRLQGNIELITLNTNSFVCLSGRVTVCYEYGIWSGEIDLPINEAGYTLSRTSCCRIENISNITNERTIGATYATKIPGTRNLPLPQHNSSPKFFIRDTALVCANKQFKLDFGAEDVDKDSLSYSFCDAYNGLSNNQTNIPSIAPTTPLNYVFPYSGPEPLGDKVIINPTTGIISGTAPNTGWYVVNVCITEWRAGIAISEHRKDFILSVQSCDLVEANLPDSIVNCKDLNVYFENGSTASSITGYVWKFGDPLAPNDSSTSPTIRYTYKDTGTFKASLIIYGPRGCEGRDSTTVIVYPGFEAKFSFMGSCIQSPFVFTDASFVQYGNIKYRLWNFGDPAINTDFSSQRNPTYQYTNKGNFTVTQIIQSDKGCRDTASLPVVVSDKPFIQLPFKDTLICSVDSLPLIANIRGVGTWTPNYNISNTQIVNPIVYPKKTTSYILSVQENTCFGSDTLTVRVVDSITVKLGNDTTICRTDALQLKPISDGLRYLWSSSDNNNIPSIKQPIVIPNNPNTTYFVHAYLGNICTSKDTLQVKTVPYPTAKLGQDAAICFGNKYLLQANFIGATFNWQPTSSLINIQTLTPTAGPTRTTTYIFTVYDTIGCPKPSRDSILIKVIPLLSVNAGRDTAIVFNQPLQLIATTTDDSTNFQFLWTPSIGLNATNIQNPIATLGTTTDSVRYTVRMTSREGCSAEDQILVKVFKTQPDIFIPTGFSPNDDGKNDVLKPIPVGIVQFNYFSVFNRWGEVMFTTKQIGEGWDGRFKGVKQPSGSYIFIAEGIDYQGKRIYKKGTTVLIR
ncbi:MAG: gliding motility-associated C-terminal domain-containing protein [Chitinophagaceae bacterium]